MDEIVAVVWAILELVELDCVGEVVSMVMLLVDAELTFPAVSTA